MTEHSRTEHGASEHSSSTHPRHQLPALHEDATAPAELLKQLLAIAREAAAAGAAVLAGRGTGTVAADTKSAAGDWVTDFDRRAEIAVRDVIAAARPNDEITGEEYGQTVPADPSGYRWSIDPLDGTANFVRGILYYCTSVAVFGPDPRNPGTGTWLAGAVNAPALGTEYHAVAGGGAWLGEPRHGMHDTNGAQGAQGALGAPDAAADRQPPQRAPRRLGGGDREETGKLLATGFGYDAERRQFQVGALLGMMPGYANVRRLGSAALDLCLVADGTLDAYAEYGTHEFDWAAGALIAQEAGLPVLRPVGYPGWQAAGFLDFAALPEPTA